MLTFYTDNMPLPTPPGALPRAYRVLCLRCARRKRNTPGHTCTFTSTSSKKCDYCTRQKGLCRPVSIRFMFGLSVNESRFHGTVVRNLMLSKQLGTMLLGGPLLLPWLR